MWRVGSVAVLVLTETLVLAVERGADIVVVLVLTRTVVLAAVVVRSTREPIK
jgi:hypothetical protein